MTTNELTDIAIQAGLIPNTNWLVADSRIEAFANLIAAREREACAKAIENLPQYEALGIAIAMLAIRARKETES